MKTTTNNQTSDLNSARAAIVDYIQQRDGLWRILATRRGADDLSAKNDFVAAILKTKTARSLLTPNEMRVEMGRAKLCKSSSPALPHDRLRRHRVSRRASTRHGIMRRHSHRMVASD